MPLVSIVIPVLNEAASLARLCAELEEVAEQQRYDLQITFVDDGSTDASWATIVGLAETNDRVQGIRFRRNFGKAAALSAGFRAARGELIMTLDADLQDDPHEIPKFFASLEQNHDLVSGWKQVRHDPWHKVLPSRVFNWMVSALTGVELHDHNCGMKCYRADVLREIRLYGEMHRFVPVLASARGFRVGEVVINHRARQFGRSKYGFTRFLKGFLDLITVKFLTSYGGRPQHVLGTLGLAALALSALGVVYLVLHGLAAWAMPGWGLQPTFTGAVGIVTLVALLLGVQLFTTGLVAEMVASTSARDEDAYSVAEQTPERAKPGAARHEHSA